MLIKMTLISTNYTECHYAELKHWVPPTEECYYAEFDGHWLSSIIECHYAK